MDSCTAACSLACVVIVVISAKLILLKIGQIICRRPNIADISCQHCTQQSQLMFLNTSIQREQTVGDLVCHFCLSGNVPDRLKVSAPQL